MDSEDRMMIGVEYTGSDAIQRFGRDLEILPTEVLQAIEAMAAAAGKDENLLRTRGAAIAKAFKAGVALEMASSQGLLSVAGLSGDAFGKSVASAAGVPERNTRQIQAIASAVNTVRQQMMAGTQQLFQGADMSAVTRQIQAVTAATEKSAAAFGVARQQREAFNRVPTPIQRDIQAISSAPLPAAEKRIAMSQAISERTAAPVVPQYSLSSQALIAAGKDVRFTDLTQASLTQAQMAIARGQGQSRTSVANEYGVDVNTVRRVETAFSDLILRVREQEKVFDALVLAGTRLKQAEMRQMDGQLTFNRLAGSGSASAVGSSMGLGAQITPWAIGTNRYADTAMGRQFYASMGLSTSAERGAPMTGSSFRSFEEILAGMPQADRRWNAGGNGGFRDSFITGFSGPQSSNVGEMVGQTARISLFYGVAYRALSVLQQGLQGAVTETLAYEDALTNLNIVTDRTRAANEAFASALSDIATSAGFTPSQGVELGSKALGLYGVASADQATQESTVALSAEVATRMARVAGSDPIATQTQLAGALRSLGWGVDRLPQLEDTISYISRQTGQAPTELLGAVSNIATLGTQAGFSPQMLAALVAQVGTTTGQNPEATAGQFRQLLSRSATELAPKASQIVGQDLSGMDLQQMFAAVSHNGY